jgi:hypothetical protein
MKKKTLKLKVAKFLGARAANVKADAPRGKVRCIALEIGHKSCPCPDCHDSRQG